MGYLLTSHISTSSGYLDDVMAAAAMATPSVAAWAVAHSNLLGTLGHFPKQNVIGIHYPVRFSISTTFSLANLSFRVEMDTCMVDSFVACMAVSWMK